MRDCGLFFFLFSTEILNLDGNACGGLESIFKCLSIANFLIESQS